ncbi:MAG: 30S ribosomal protein S20 [Deltaproteobacteria bacterium]|nr:30S ribosomal protein S20 [Deltaproteobacteria bacterium]
MANHKSALKRARQNEGKRLRNLTYKTRAKKAIKQVRAAIAVKSDEQAKESLRKAVSIIQKSSSKGVIPRKRASRKISNLANQINRITPA